MSSVYNVTGRGRRRFSIAGDFTNNDTFTAQSGTVTFDGTGQSILGSTAFYNLTKSVAAADTLTFQAGQTTTINGTVTLNGAAVNLLALRSTTPGTQWLFNVNAGASKAIDYVDVQDSDASGSDSSQHPIDPTNSVNSGNEPRIARVARLTRCSSLKKLLHRVAYVLKHEYPRPPK